MKDRWWRCVLWIRIWTVLYAVYNAKQIAKRYGKIQLRDLNYWYAGGPHCNDWSSYDFRSTWEERMVHRAMARMLWRNVSSGLCYICARHAFPPTGTVFIRGIPFIVHPQCYHTCKAARGSTRDGSIERKIFSVGLTTWNGRNAQCCSSE